MNPKPGSGDAPDLTSGPTSAPASGSDSSDGFGRYRFLQRLGEGGMGEVWLAEQLRPVRRQVAIKIVKAGMDTAQVVARFEAERQALAVMDHPAIAKVFDGGTTPEGRPYFAMEYVRGEAMTSYCDRQRLSVSERLELFTELCDGVTGRVDARGRGHAQRCLFPWRAAKMYMKQQRYRKAESAALAAYEAYASRMGADHDDTQRMVKQLADLYAAAGRLRESDEWRAKLRHK